MNGKSPIDQAHSAPKTPIMAERLIPFTVNGRAMQSFLCTPADLEELALGFLLTQGMVESPGQVTCLAATEEGIALSTSAPLGRPLPLQDRMAALAPAKATPPPTRQEISDFMAGLMAQNTHYGTHTLGLCCPYGRVFRQDVGRHNAMDKVIGWAAMAGVDFSLCRVAATGRISLEMLYKAASVGIPVIISKKYPSDLAIQAARKLSIRIIGYALQSTPVDFMG